MPAATGDAQVWQRVCGCPKRTTHASHTGCAGQARHTTHWLGKLLDKLFNRVRNIESIYPPRRCDLSMSTERPPTIDPQAALRWGGRAQSASPWLHEEVARRMEDRLKWIKMQPQAWVDWEPVRGGLAAHAALARRYPKAQCFVFESSPHRMLTAKQALGKPWWKPSRWVGPPPRFQPPDEGAVQLLWANMALHMAADPQALLTQWHRALAPDGFLMFSCLGPDTLRELRDVYRSSGWPPPAHEFTDMHDWGDMLVNAGFAEPVMDTEQVTLTFDNGQRLLDELRELGRNLHTGRFPALRAKRWRGQLLMALAAQCRPSIQPQPLGLTFEIIYGHAFKPKPRLTVQSETVLSLDQMRSALRQGRTSARGRQQPVGYNKSRVDQGHFPDILAVSGWCGAA